MKNVNTAAAAFSANEALEFMASRQGIDKEVLAAWIAANPTGEAAQYFKKLLVAGYEAIAE